MTVSVETVCVTAQTIEMVMTYLPDPVSKKASASAVPPDVRHGFALPSRAHFHVRLRLLPRAFVTIRLSSVYDPAKGGAQKESDSIAARQSHASHQAAQPKQFSIREMSQVFPCH